MAQMSSEDALNGIFNILETMVAQQQKEAEKTPEAKADDTVISLLTGIVETSKENTAGTAGEQLEKLAKGLTAMNEVDNDMIDHVATSIGNINKVLNNLQVDDSTVSNVEKFISTLDRIGEINAEGSKKIIEFINNLQFADSKAAMQNISVVIGIVRAMNIIASTDIKALLKNLDRLDNKTAGKLGKFIETLITSIKDSVPSDKEILNMIKPIAQIMLSLASITNSGILKMKIGLNPIRGWLLGKTLGKFIGLIVDGVKGKELDESIKYLGSVLDPIVKLINPQGKFGIYYFKFGKGTAQAIGLFFKTLVKEIPASKDLKETMDGVKTVLDILLTSTIRDIIRINIAAKLLSLDAAIKVNEFIKTLISGDWDTNKLEQVTEFMSSFSKLIMCMTGALVIITAVSTFAPIESVIAGSAVLYFTIRFMRNAILYIVNEIKNGDIKDATALILSIGKTIMILSGTAAMIALVTKFVGVGSIVLGTGIMFFTLISVKNIIAELCNKEFKDNLDSAAIALKGMSFLILSMSLSIAIVAGTIAGFGLVATGLGFLVIYGFVRMSLYSIKTLAGIDDKSVNNATNALLKISGVFAIIALVSATLLIPIGKQLGHVTKGGVVVSAIIALGIYAINMMQNIKNLDEATTSLLKLAGVFTIISLVTDILLIPIGKKLKEAVFGGIVVTTIVGILIAGVELISNTKEGNLKNAIKILAALTLIYAGLSLLVKYIIIPIGKYAQEAFFGATIVSLIELSLIASVKLLQLLSNKELTNTLIILASVTLIFGLISVITKELLIPIGLNFADSLQGAIATITLLSVLVLGVKIISSMNVLTFKDALITLASVVLIYGLISVITKELLIPIGHKMGEAILGAITTITLLGVLLIGVKLISEVKVETFKNALITLAAVTLIYAGISLIAKELLIPVGDYFTDAITGAGSTILILGALIFGVYILNKVDSKNILYATAALASLAFIYVGIALITKGILIPIGEHSKDAAFGAGVTLLIIGALIIGVYVLNKISGRDALYAILATASIAVILMGISLITKEILIPIGKQWDKALIGASAVLGIISVFGVIMFAVGELTRSHHVQEALIRGGITLMGISAVILAIGICMSVFAPISQKIGENSADILQGSGIIVLILAAIGSVMGGVGLLVKNPQVQDALVSGGITLMGISAVMLIVGLCMTQFIPIAIKAGENVNNILLGSGIIVLLISAIGAVMVGIGMLLSGPQSILIAEAIAVGAAFMLGISAVITVVAGVINLFIGTISSIMKYDGELIKKAGSLLCSTFGVMFDVIAAAAPNPIQAIQAAAAAAFAIPALAVIGMLKMVVNAINSIVHLVTVDTIHAFSQIVIGSGINDPNSILGSLNNIITAFSKFDGVAKALIISYAIRPVIDTIGLFIDVIMKVSTMSYISGYDDNGKPIYTKLSPDVFSRAANVVTKNFMEFLKTLSKGFKEDVSVSSIIAIGLLTKALKPIIDVVGQFVDVVMKVATGTFITGYDDNGKPIYEHLTAPQFAEAGNAVAEKFQYFIETLGTAFDKMGFKAIWAMNSLKDTMGPIMSSVKDFVDTVIKVATMQVVTGYDKEGHPLFEQIDVDTFKRAGENVADTFKVFITNLGKSFKGLEPSAIWAMESMKDSIAPIMQGVSSFVDSILKLSTGQYVDHYDVIRDNDGNLTLVPRFKRVTKDEYIKASEIIAKNFAMFIDNLTTVFSKHGGFWGNKTEDALEAIGNSIAPVMEGVGQYVNAILQLATGTYVDHMAKDKDGKWVPIYKHLQPNDFIKAAATVQTMFISFIDALINAMSKGNFIKKAEAAKEAISESITPIMQAVKDFSEALKPFLEMTTKSKDNVTKASDYICLQPKKIIRIAKGIANAFVTFISIISKHLGNSKNKKMYDDIKGTAKNVQDVLNLIKKSTGNLASIIKYMTDENGAVLKQGKDVATLFSSVLTMFATYFLESGKIFMEATSNVKDCKKMIDEIEDVSKVYIKIINNVKKLDDKDVKAQDLVNSFNNNLTKITDEMITISNKSETINFMMIREMTDTYLRIALMLALTSDFMVEHEDMETGINKFIVNVSKLTAPDFNRLMESSAGSINLYTARLNDFTQQVEFTTGKIEIYTTKLEAAKKALAALDDQIISKSKARDKALESFANKINNIATAFDNMRDAFESLDENSILNRFDGIRALLDLITSNSNMGQVSYSQSNSSYSQTQYSQSSNSSQYNQNNHTVSNNRNTQNNTVSNNRNTQNNTVSNNRNTQNNTNKNIQNTMHNTNQNTQHHVAQNTQHTQNVQHHTTQNAQYHTAQNAQSQRPVVYQGMPSSGMVTFEFKDVTLRGFFRSR